MTAADWSTMLLELSSFGYGDPDHPVLRTDRGELLRRVGRSGSRRAGLSAATVLNRLHKPGDVRQVLVGCAAQIVAQRHLHHRIELDRHHGTDGLGRAGSLMSRSAPNMRVGATSSPCVVHAGRWSFLREDDPGAPQLDPADDDRVEVAGRDLDGALVDQHLGRVAAHRAVGRSRPVRSRVGPRRAGPDPGSASSGARPPGSTRGSGGRDRRRRQPPRPPCRPGRRPARGRRGRAGRSGRPRPGRACGRPVRSSRRRIVSSGRAVANPPVGSRRAHRSGFRPRRLPSQGPDRRASGRGRPRGARPGHRFHRPGRLPRLRRGRGSGRGGG